MTSFGAKQVIEDGFIPTFKVQGQVYHLAGSLLPEPGEVEEFLTIHKFLQIYFVREDDSEVNIRCSNYQGLKPGLVKLLQKMLHDVNPYIRPQKYH